MRRSILALSVAAAALCAPGLAHAQEFVSDPHERFNRRMFAINESLDHAIVEPVAKGYRAIAPQPVRTGISNFLHNLRSPVIFANDLLQGNLGRAGTTAARFGVNSTIGVLGFVDAAQGMGLERHDSDFGQTLGVWGVSSGPYAFMPILGPSTLRDTVGDVVDLVIDPLTWARFDGDAAFRVTRVVATGVSEREEALDAVDSIRRTSMDPYVTIRTSYGLLRYSAVQNGRRGAQSLPEFEEIPEAPPNEAQPQSPPSNGQNIATPNQGELP